jgi:hypothetical protein
LKVEAVLAMIMVWRSIKNKIDEKRNKERFEMEKRLKKKELEWRTFNEERTENKETFKAECKIYTYISEWQTILTFIFSVFLQLKITSLKKI